MISMEDIRRWGGKEMLDPEGEKIGTIEDFYLQKASMEPEWVVVKRDFLGLSEKLVPFQAIEWREDYAVACYDKDQVTHSPGPGIDGRLSDEEELKLFDHYGLSREQPLHHAGVTGATDHERAQAQRMAAEARRAEGAEAYAPERGAERYERDRTHDRERLEEEARRAHPLSTDLDEEGREAGMPQMGLAAGTRPEPGERSSGHYREASAKGEGEAVSGSTRLIRVKKYLVTERTERVALSDEEFEDQAEESRREERPGEDRRAA